MNNNVKIDLNVKCPLCKADLLTHKYGVIEDIMQYTPIFECIFCGHQFYDRGLVVKQREIKIKKICQSMNI